MSGIEVHFFHGFLGEPKDWRKICENIQGVSPDQLICHDVLAYAMAKEDNFFESWACAVEKKLSLSQNKKIIVGYSLGGRLASYLKPSLYERLMLIGVNPGLRRGHRQRLVHDQAWIRRAKELNQKDWVSEWNSQPIFLNDRNRPQRQLTHGRFQSFIPLLAEASVSKQKDLRPLWSDLVNKLRWVCGENDKKYFKLSGELVPYIGTENIEIVPQAGHGVIFDQPQWVAQWIDREIDHA